jgi:hypothetical protein
MDAVVGFLKTYWVYALAVVAVVLLWVFWPFSRTFNPTLPKGGCSSCPGGGGGGAAGKK